MRQPTWQEIEAEAQRRGRLESDTTGRRWTLAEKIVEVINEGWTPPPAVDPDILAFREWVRSREARPEIRWAAGSGEYDGGLLAEAFLAGARMAREKEDGR